MSRRTIPLMPRPEAGTLSGMEKGVVLIGFMGAGKSSIGRLLAQRLDLPWRDTDPLIEEAAGMKISDIFAAYGEDVFRDMEHDTLRELLRHGPAVYSTGGGIVGREDNWSLLRQLGTVVYLRATPDTLFERVRRHGHRPLLRTPDPRGTFDDLFGRRQALYEGADEIIDTDGRRPDEVADELARRLSAAGAWPHEG